MAFTRKFVIDLLNILLTLGKKYILDSIKIDNVTGNVVSIKIKDAFPNNMTYTVFGERETIVRSVLIYYQNKILLT